MKLNFLAALLLVIFMASVGCASKEVRTTKVCVYNTLTYVMLASGGHPAKGGLCEENEYTVGVDL